jgi:hypothetical protein
MDSFFCMIRPGSSIIYLHHLYPAFDPIELLSKIIPIIPPLYKQYFKSIPSSLCAAICHLLQLIILSRHCHLPQKAGIHFLSELRTLVSGTAKQSLTVACHPVPINLSRESGNPDFHEQ